MGSNPTASATYTALTCGNAHRDHRVHKCTTSRFGELQPKLQPNASRDPVAEDVTREGVGRLGVRRGQHVRVGVEREPDAGVAQALRDDLDLVPAGRVAKTDAGVGVADVAARKERFMRAMSASQTALTTGPTNGNYSCIFDEGVWIARRLTALRWTWRSSSWRCVGAGGC